MIRQPQTWLFPSMSFLSAGLAVFQVDWFPNFGAQNLSFVTIALFPTALLLLAGVVFRWGPKLRGTLIYICSGLAPHVVLTRIKPPYSAGYAIVRMYNLCARDI